MKTTKEILARAKELEDELNKGTGTGQPIIEVSPLCISVSDTDQAVGYIRHPNYDEMAYAFEKMATGNSMEGAEAILDRCLIKEDSDARFLDKSFAKLRFTAVRECIQFVKGFDNEVKKKSTDIPIR